jgi:hypothetical protein
MFKSLLDMFHSSEYYDYNKNQLFTGAPLRENRESGVSPGRTRHCKGELLPGPLCREEGGKEAMNLSQETCL